MIAESVARTLLEVGAVSFNPKNPITFKSGIVSPVYVDNRRLPYYPQHWHVVIDGFQEFVQTKALNFDVVAGVAVGGIPHSSALAYMMQKPSVFVRKEAKEHGKQQLIEGGDVGNKHVLLVEDMVTTGGSSLRAVKALKDEKASVHDVIAIVSYGFEEASQNFARESVTLHTLTNFEAILSVAIQTQRITHDEQKVIEDWFNDPYGWGQRNFS